MFSNSANCSSCASISKRAQLINDLIRNQHEVVTSLLSERRVSTAARKIATQLRQQNEHLSSECTSISEEYKAALEKLSPLETRVTELENEVSVKCTELEKMRQDLSLAHLSGNGAVTSAQKSDTLEQEKQIRELEDKLREQKAKVSRDTVKKRKCTTKMKDLLRLKGMLGNTVADRIISELASLLEVALKPDEVEALELERQLMAEDRKQQTLPAQQGVGSTPEAQFAYSSASDYSTQTDWSVSNCQTQTSPSSTVTKEVQVGIFEERDSSQIAGLHENDPNSVKYNIVATAAGRSSESQQNEGEKSLLDDKQLTSEHDESRDRLQQADDKRDSAGTSDQAVQVSCSLIDAAIHQSSPESLQLLHTLKITRKDQIVQATCTTLDAAICTVPCRTQEQQQLALDVGTCMSPIRFSPQTCSKCFEKFQGSEVLLSDAVVSEDPSDKAVAAGIKGTSRLGSMDDESNEETKTAKHSDDGHKLELSNEPIEQKLRLSNCHKAEAPRSLLDCIPAIEVDEDRDDPLSPPQGTLIPRKKEKRVSFVDQGVTDGPAHDNSEDSDERIMRELEMIIAEMRHPFANHRDIIRELSPLPPSPVPPSLHSNKRKKKRHREKGADANKPDIDQQPQKRLAHQNSTGFDPLLSSFPSSPALNACWPSSAPTSAQEQCAVPCTGDNRDNTSRLKAEVAHMPESGVTTFSFQIPSGGSSRISIDFDQTTRQLQLSCQTPKMISAPEVLPSSLNEERISSGNYAIQPREGSGRPSLDFSAPSGGGERCWRSPDETLLRRRISTVNNESIQHGSVDQYSQKAGTFVQQLDTRSEVSEQTLQTTYREDSIENSVFDQSEDHTQTNDDFKYVQAKQPWDIAKDHLKEGDKQQRRNVLPIRYPSILKQDRRLKRLSKQRKNKSDSLINDTRKCTPKSSINKSILDAREKMMQRKAKVDRKGPADSDLESYSAAEVCSKNQLVTSNLSTSVLVEEENISNATNDAEIINQDCIDAFSENPEIEGHLEVSLEGDEVGPAIVTARVNEVDVLAGSAGAEQSQNESIDQMEENVSDQIEEPTPALSDAIVNSKESENCQEIIEINAIIDPPPPWVLRNLNGELYQSPIKEDNLSNSDSEEEMCIAVELEDKTFTPMSPEYTEVADRGMAKLIPTEFDENMAHFVYGSIQNRQAKEPNPENMLPPPDSPTESPSSVASITTRRMAKIIPSSPLRNSSQNVFKTMPKRVSPRTCVKQKLTPKPTELLGPIELAASARSTESKIKHPDNKPTTCLEKSTGSKVADSRPATRNGMKISMLKDSYVAEKEDYTSDTLFGYDNTTISVASASPVTSVPAHTKSCDEDACTAKVDKMPMLAGFFKQNKGRFPRFESLLKSVAEDATSMDAVVNSLMNENQVRKIYVSLVYVLIDVNCGLNEDEQQISRQEKNLMEFLLKKMPAIKKYEGKTSHAIALSCVNFIRAYLMSPSGSTRSVLELSSLLKVLALVAQETPSERRQLLDEMYYFMADRTGEAAYLICCFLAVWPGSLSQVEFDSPMGFILRYVLYHHPSVVPQEDLQKARTAALRSGWKPLPPTGTSLAEAIERFTPVVFGRRAESAEMSRLALQALELLLTVQGDPGQARVVLEGNIPRLLAPEAGCSQWEVHSLLQLCGKVWKKFGAHGVAQVTFESTIEGMLRLMEQLSPEKEDTKEFCRKAFWSYASYDKDSEWSSRAKQHCMKQLAKNKRNKMFSQKNDKKYNTINNNNNNKKKNKQKSKTPQRASGGVTSSSSTSSKQTRKKGKQIKAKSTKINSH